MDDACFSNLFGKERGTKMIRVLMCGPLATSGGVSTHTKKLIKYLSMLDVEITFFNFVMQENKFLNKSQFLSSIFKIYQRTFGLFKTCILNRNNFELVHIQSSGGLGSFISSVTGVIVSKITGKSIIITFHHSKTEQFVQKYKFIFGFVLNNVDRMILVSNKQKDIISKFFPQFSNKLIVLPNGYDSTLFGLRDLEECRNILNLPIGTKIIFNVSNLIESKGHNYLIDAMKDVIIHKKDVICIIVGQGYFKDKLESQINTLGLSDYVKLLGWKPDDDIPVFMNACDLFVLPSLNEGNPTVMFECLGCGKPFVGTTVGGMPEIIFSSDYGLLAEPKNSKELSENILSALDKKWDRRKIKEYGEQFTWGNISTKVFQIYSNVLDL